MCLAGGVVSVVVVTRVVVGFVVPEGERLKWASWSPLFASVWVLGLDQLAHCCRLQSLPCEKDGDFGELFGSPAHQGKKKKGPSRLNSVFLPLRARCCSLTYYRGSRFDLAPAVP
ncbi:hypothetical protein V8F20_008377 [Naviculisporaceae sp. PSN 640]